MGIKSNFKAGFTLCLDIHTAFDAQIRFYTGSEETGNFFFLIIPFCPGDEAVIACVKPLLPVATPMNSYFAADFSGVTVSSRVRLLLMYSVPARLLFFSSSLKIRFTWYPAPTLLILQTLPPVSSQPIEQFMV